MHVVDLTSRIGEDLDLDVSPTLVYECVTIAAMATNLLEELVAFFTVQVASALNSGHNLAAGGAHGPVGGALREPAAVIGMACRLPGDANDVDTYWDNLCAGVNSVVQPPKDRPHNGRPSGYLSADTLKRFDCRAFRISPAEARAMDPQQRLLLEVAYEAFEDAGVVLDTLEDRKVGVFVGISAVDYGALAQERRGAVPVSAYSGTAWSISIAANRLSHVFDLRGPSMSLDTACSSSLVAVDSALAAMRSGQCSMALVCGANIQLRKVNRAMHPLTL